MFLFSLSFIFSCSYSASVFIESFHSIQFVDSKSALDTFIKRPIFVHRDYFFVLAICAHTHTHTCIRLIYCEQIYSMPMSIVLSLVHHLCSLAVNNNDEYFINKMGFETGCVSFWYTCGRVKCMQQIQMNSNTALN